MTDAERVREVMRLLLTADDKPYPCSTCPRGLAMVGSREMFRVCAHTEAPERNSLAADMFGDGWVQKRPRWCPLLPPAVRG